MADYERRGLHEQCRLVVGMPLISSSGNLAFWLSLAGCVGRPACRQLLAGFVEAEQSGGMQGAAQHCTRYNEDLLTQVRSCKLFGHAADTGA